MSPAHYCACVPDCIFCAIAAGDIPADVLISTETTVALTDIAPKAEVHVLVIPRDHYANLAELAAADPQLSAALIETAAAVARDLGVEGGYRLVANTGAAAGQTVFHAHLHLLAGNDLPGF